MRMENQHTKTRIPNNPAFVFKMITPETPEGEMSFVAIQQTIEPDGNNQYKMSFKGIETKNVYGSYCSKRFNALGYGFRRILSL